MNTDSLRRVPAGRWATRNRASIVLLAGLLAGVTAVQATGCLSNPSWRPDEGVYVAQAWALERYGVLSHYTYWYDHPPLGWQLIALWIWTTRALARLPQAVSAGREVMLLTHVISSALLWVLARRMSMQRGFAALAVVLFTVCPLALQFHRMVLLDNLAMLWLLAAFALGLSPRRHVWAVGSSGICFAAAVLTKETALLLLPVLFLAIRAHSDLRTHRFGMILFGCGFALMALVYPLFAALKGELLAGPGHVSLEEAIRWQLFERDGSGSLLDPTSTGRRVVEGWMNLDVWLVGGSLALAPAGLLIRRLRPVALALLIQAAMTLRSGYLPDMYVVGFLPFASLLVAGTGDALWKWQPGAPDRPVGAHEAATRSGSGRLELLLHPGPLLTTCCLAAAMVMIGPAWIDHDRRLMTTNANAPFLMAERWLVDNVGDDSPILVDDFFWLDLVEQRGSKPFEGGYFSDTVVWWYKLDLDPAIAKRFPGGWRDFEYIVSTRGLRNSLYLVPQVRQALQNSRLMATFGKGPHRIEIRKIRRTSEG
jgi:hypothetical protein